MNATFSAYVRENCRVCPDFENSDHYIDSQGPLISQNDIEKEQSWSPDLKTYYKTADIKIVFYGHNKRHIAQWNRIENAGINLHICGQMTFDKGTKTIQWKKDSLFNK